MLRCPQEPCPSHNRRSPRRADTHSLEAGEGGSTASATEKGCSCFQFNSYRAQRGHGFAEGSDLIRRCGQGAQPLPERLCGCSSPRRLPGPVILSRSRRRGSAGAPKRLRTGPVSRRLVGLAGLRGRAGEARGRRSEDEKSLKAGSRCRPTSAHPAVGNVPFDQVPRPRPRTWRLCISGRQGQPALWSRWTMLFPELLRGRVWDVPQRRPGLQRSLTAGPRGGPGE